MSMAPAEVTLKAPPQEEPPMAGLADTGILFPQTPATGVAETDPLWVWEDDFIQAQYGESCPVWGDTLPQKSVTVLVPAGMQGEAVFSLEFAHGGGSISRQKLFPNGMLAIRSDYQCW
jgi:hypothetical protein